MKIETLQKCDKSKYYKLTNFIYSLLRDKELNRQTPLEYIDINDWECNTKPSIYIHNKKNMFKIKRYSRCSEYDVKLAIKFYNS
jgi:hypothetical protein